MRKLALALPLTLALVASSVFLAGICDAGAAARPTGDVAPAKDSDVPLCSPYTAEGPSEICELQKIHLDVYGRCDFKDPSGSCAGHGSGPFPWGKRADGSEPWVIFNWNPGRQDRDVVFISQEERSSSDFITRMEARLPGPGSAALMVDRARVRTETGIAEFFTPNLPGQEPGEPGGPLYLNFENGWGSHADAYIHGYLYVKR